MNERLLQFIWQFRYFNLNELFSVDGEPIMIIHAGNYTTNQGPDFLDAKIKIGDTTWAGNVELHVQSSDWVIHQHSKDGNYNNIILHVVWKDDVVLDLPFPVLELQSKVSKLLLKKYYELMQAGTFIPCQNNLQHTDELTFANWKERVLVERLQEKSQVVMAYLANNNNHWEETFWWLLAKNFGLKVNSEPFEKIARSLPLAVLAKHKSQVNQVEALLFGQAGLLTGEFKDDYCILLQKEYAFLQKKYQLVPVKIPLHFLRMRPSNFPTVRLAQLSMLVHNSLHLFSAITATEKLSGVKKMLDVTANDYWHYHYLLDEASTFKEKNLGAQMINNILINTVIPILFVYGQYLNENKYKEKALRWLEETAAEKNSIIQGFAATGIKIKNAFDSQALIQLKNNYCNKKRCLECAIGNKILKSPASK